MRIEPSFVPTALLGLSLGLAAAGCATNPATGDTQLSLISEEQEIQMGQQAAQQVETSIGLVEDPELQEYVSRIGQSLAAESERPDLPWSFQVVDDPGVNAFALPGGFIYVTRGILATFMSEAELAAVLGHEIGHVTARHSVNQLSQQQVLGGLAGLGAAVFDLGSTTQGLLGTGLNLLFLKYSRDDEREADELGLRYMTRERYAPREMLDVFRTLQRVGESAGGSGTPGWLSTHPAPADRLERIAERIDQDTVDLADPVVERAAYLQQVDGLVYGQDPRNGFFRDQVFLHPELAFRLQFPQGWQTRNLPQAVVGSSPDQQAALQLTLVEGSSASAAVQAFGGQDGVRLGQASTTRIDGLPAAVGGFEADAEQGTLRGLVAAIEYEGRVYQILGYTGASAFASWEGTFRETMGSFGAVRDASTLDVEPRRLDLVRIGTALDLQAFARQHSPGADVETLSLINGVPADGTLEPGTWKRIVGDARFGN
ncbi:MAG: M48 family metalloprotease [Gemmatimonadota bacterium]|nr:M48 family metalloprotease [Gemmatimonadota bacterium]